MNGLKELAKEAGLLDETNGWDVWFPDNLEAFAKLVAAKEREACAKVCEDIEKLSEGIDDAPAYRYYEAIRARS